jgi:hypothetical protein
MAAVVRRILANLLGWGGLLALLTALAIWIAQTRAAARAAEGVHRGVAVHQPQREQERRLLRPMG